ncbi:MAG: hypothetical protein AAFR37_13755 [Cyanobacteria bacterium J06628_3]
MGNLTAKGLENLIGISAISNLNTLDVSNNCISEEFIEEVEKFSLLDYWLIADNQEEIAGRGVGVSRYLAIHE